MKCGKSRIEAAKLLFAEIMEVNQELSEDRWVSFSFTGSSGLLRVIFWKTDETDEENEIEAEEDFSIYLHNEIYTKSRKCAFADISAKLNEWRELFGNSEEKD